MKSHVKKGVRYLPFSSDQTKKISNEGFSIVELIIAIIVGTGFFLTINSAVNSYVHLATRNRSLVLANSFAEGEVEALRNQGYNSINTGITSLTSQMPSGLHSPKSSSMTVTTPTAGIKKIDITVTYKDQVSRSFSYTTYIGELGVGQ